MDLITGLLGDNLITVLRAIIAFLIVLTVIVFVHELGHFLAARWVGIGVRTFSVGFGPEIAGFYDRRGTRWRISAIPLGGYVKFVGDENEASQQSSEALDRLSEDERKKAFGNKSVGARAFVVARGAGRQLHSGNRYLHCDVHDLRASDDDSQGRRGGG